MKTDYSGGGAADHFRQQAYFPQSGAATDHPHINVEKSVGVTRGKGELAYPDQESGLGT